MTSEDLRRIILELAAHAVGQCKCTTMQCRERVLKLARPFVEEEKKDVGSG